MKQTEAPAVVNFRFSILPESAKHLLGDGDDDSRAKNGSGFK